MALLLRGSKFWHRDFRHDDGAFGLVKVSAGVVASSLRCLPGVHVRRCSFCFETLTRLNGVAGRRRSHLLSPCPDTRLVPIHFVSILTHLYCTSYIIGIERSSVPSVNRCIAGHNVSVNCMLLDRRPVRFPPPPSRCFPLLCSYWLVEHSCSRLESPLGSPAQLVKCCRNNWALSVV